MLRPLSKGALQAHLVFMTKIQRAFAELWWSFIISMGKDGLEYNGPTNLCGHWLKSQGAFGLVFIGGRASKPGSPTGLWGPIRTLGHRTPTYLHPSQKWIFLGNTELDIFTYKRSQRNLDEINIKAKSGNPCPRACTPVNQVGQSRCRIGSIMNTTVCLSQTEIQFHILLDSFLGAD